MLLYAPTRREAEIYVRVHECKSASDIAEIKKLIDKDTKEPNKSILEKLADQRQRVIERG